jgi:putative FmdB family regulatory protein
MPTYEYRAEDKAKACDYCRIRFEYRQAMSDDPLTACPECGRPVERVISLCSISTTQSSKSMLSDDNLKKKGFTKLVNEGDGKFRNVTAD